MVGIGRVAYTLHLERYTQMVNANRLQSLVDNGTFRFVWMWVDDNGKVTNQIPLSGTELLRIKSDVVRVCAYAPNVMMVFTK